MRFFLIWGIVAVPVLLAETAKITPETVMEYSVEQMESVIEAYPEQALPYFSLGRIYYRSYRFSEGIDQYRKGLEYAPDDPEAMYMIAFLHEKLTDDEAAIDWYERTVAVAPDYPNAYERLGLAHDRLGNAEEALEALRLAVKHTPDDPSSHYYYAMELFEADDLEASKIHAERCIELDERLSEPYYLLARIERAQGNNEAARDILTTFRERKLTEQQLFDELPRVDDEESAMRAAVTTHLDAFALHYANNNPESARQHLEQAVEFAPENEQVRVTQLEFAQMEQDADLMEDALQALLRTRPENATYHQLLGLLYSSTDRPGDAVVHLEEAVRLEPANADVLRSYARVLLRGNLDPARALEVMRDALRFDPSGETYDLLSWAFFANGRADASIQAMRKAIELEPGNRAYQQRLQTILQRVGQQ